ncbi:MAG TPA: DUF6694 family lipoprotein [Candidatus Binatia bacterium]|nr:DUF6694 family lipoprotein [Candidatus Binatia bacterium]
MDRIRTFSKAPRPNSGKRRRRKKIASYARGTSLACLLLLAPAMDACRSEPSSDAPRIDMSSDDAAARSIERVREQLDEEQRRQLTDATLVLVRNEMRVDAKAPLDPEKARAALKKVLDGKTAAEVIQQARVVEANSAVPLSDKPPQRPVAPAAPAAPGGAGAGAPAAPPAGGGAGSP